VSIRDQSLTPNLQSSKAPAKRQGRSNRDRRPNNRIALNQNFVKGRTTG